MKETISMMKTSDFHTQDRERKLRGHRIARGASTHT